MPNDQRFFYRATLNTFPEKPENTPVVKTAMVYRFENKLVSIHKWYFFR
jgi:hypothetical protein